MIYFLKFKDKMQNKKIYRNQKNKRLFVNKTNLQTRFQILKIKIYKTKKKISMNR